MSRFSRIRMVTFDLDDTLVDTFGTIPARVRNAIEAGRRTLGLALVVEAEDAVIAAVRQGNPNERPRRLIDALGVADDAAGPVLEAYRTPMLDLLKALPGAEETLQVLAGRYELAIITNGWEALQWAKVRKFGFERYVSRVIISETVGSAKPDPAIFAAAYRPAGLRADAALHVGNSLEADVAGARAAGMAVVLLRTEAADAAAAPPGALEADAIIRELAELPGLLGLRPDVMPAEQ
ncbi:MAG: HAD family hydrolase [Dehalococcoidia bacterium]|nr:HAD family hydrolase [Dehalococcoidia bacterium]